MHQLVVLGDDQVFEHGHACEQADVLEGSRHAGALGDPIAVHLFQQEMAPRTAQSQPPDGRLVEAGKTIEDRRFASAVGADDAGDLAIFGDEGYVIHRDEPAEAHGEVFDIEKRIVAHVLGLPRLRKMVGSR